MQPREKETMRENDNKQATRAELVELKREVARLRDALKRITLASRPSEEPLSVCIARAALEGSE
jgi:hypothetical protein